MGIFDWFRGGEKRASEAYKQEWVSFADTPWGEETYSGKRVSQSTAPQLPAVYRCWSLNAETISTLPVDVYSKRGSERVPRDPPSWLEQPNDYQNWCQFLSMAQLSYEADGNIFILKASAGGGQLAGMYVLAPGAAAQVLVNDVIYKELIAGVIREESRAGFVDVINELVSRGAEGITLGCTEIPLLVSEKDVDVPLFDTTTIHAEAALAHALRKTV